MHACVGVQVGVWGRDGRRRAWSAHWRSGTCRPRKVRQKVQPLHHKGDYVSIKLMFSWAGDACAAQVVQLAPNVLPWGACILFAMQEG